MHEGSFKSHELTFVNVSAQLPEDVDPISEPVGLISHDATMHVAPCTNELYCYDPSYLAIYDAKLLPVINILPKTSAPYLARSIEAVFVGVLFGD